MQEGYVQAVGSFAGRLVDEAQSLLVAHGQSLAHAVFHLECHVMHAAPAVVEELLHGTLGARGLQQLEFHLAHLQEGGLHLLVFHHLGLVHFQSQHIAEIGQHGINALDGDAQMFNT